MSRAMLLAALIIVASLAASALSTVADTHADSAPVYGETGGTLTTAGETAVRMESETVSATIERRSEAKSGYQAHVRATFELYNPGEATSLLVGYPGGVYTRGAAAQGLFQLPEVENFTAAIDGETITPRWESVAEPPRDTFETDSSPWLVWSMDFEADARHEVTVTFEQALRPGSGALYDTEPYDGVLCLDYVLVTGVGWDGPIGTAEISVHFPEDIDLDTFYAVNPMYFVLPDETVVLREGQKIIWRSKDFEPDENFTVAFLSPDASAELQRARQIAASSNDAADHGRLAEFLFRLSNSPLGQTWAFNPGSDRLLSEGMVEVVRGLLLDPNDSAVWSALLSAERAQASTPEFRHGGEPFGTLEAVVAAARLLQIDPTDTAAAEFLKGTQEYGLTNYVDPQINAMIRQAAEAALSAGAPRAMPPTGAQGSRSSGSDSWFDPISDLRIVVACALGLARVLAGVGIVFQRSKGKFGR